MQWETESRQAQGGERKPEEKRYEWWGIDGEIREREKARKGRSLKSGVCWVFPSFME